MQRVWRPDFREVQSLPDTKVIRTGFLLNFIAISLTLIFLTIWVFREYNLWELKRNVATLEAYVAANTSENRAILDTNKRFRESSSVVEEAIAFDHSYLDFPSLVSDVSEILPEGIILSFIQLGYSDEKVGKNKIPPFTIDLTGRITGDTEETPSQIISKFQSALKDLPVFEGRSPATDLTRFNRNNEYGYFDFTLKVKIAAEPGSES